MERAELERAFKKKIFQKETFSVISHWAGAIPFEKSLALQKELKARAKEGEFCFLGFESLSLVISMGLRADSSHILWPEKKIKARGLSFIKIKRGGEATLHAPGQLVIYPVAHLPSLGLRVRDFIRALETISQDFLEDLGVKAHKEGKQAGLFTKSGKICFFGIHISEGVSQHGLSVNVDNDLSFFDAIKSCGETKRSHDKLAFYPSALFNKRELFEKWSAKALDFLRAL